MKELYEENKNFRWIDCYTQTLIKLEHFGVTEQMLVDAYIETKEEDDGSYDDFCSNWVSEQFFINYFAPWPETKQGAKFWNEIDLSLDRYHLWWNNNNDSWELLDLVKINRTIKAG